MATNIDYVKIVNSVNKQLGGMYGYEFPIVNSSTFKAMAGALLNAPDVIQNAYINALRNVMCNVAIKKVYRSNNVFRKLYREDSALTADGDQYIYEVALDQFIPLAYEMTSDPASFFKSAPPKVKVQFLCNVLRKKYVVTLNEFVLQPAFQSLNTFASFWESTMARLYADMEEDDKEEILAALDGVIEGGNMRLYPMTRPVDSSTALNFSKELEVISNDLAFRRSRDYNLQRLSTKTAEEDAILLVAGDVISVQQTYNLAWAFHKSLLTWLENGQMIKLDSKGLADNRVFAIYTDTDFFRIHNVKNFPILKQWENSDNLEEKRWLHNWKMINFSYASNALAFVEPKDIGVKSVTIKDVEGNSSSTVKAGKFVQLALPEVVAVDGKLADAFCSFSISGQTDSKTRVDQDGTIWISPDEPSGTVITVLAKSHLDENVTDDYKITVA